MKFKTTLETSFSLIDLTPLVDVVLLMLVFFIVTSDILPLKSLNVEPPALDVAAPPRTSQILVVMDAQNVLYVGSNKEIVDLDGFKESLQHEIDMQPDHADTTVVLSIDRRVDYETFLRLFSLVQDLEVKMRLAYNDTSES